MENITNQAVLNAMKGVAEPGATKAAGNTTTPLPASSPVAPAIAPTNESTGIQPLAPKTPVLASPASNETMSANSVGVQPSGPILPLNASSIGVLPSPVPTPASSAVVPGQSTTAAVPEQFPFPVAGIPTQTSSMVAPIPASSPVAGVPAQPPKSIAPAQAPFPVAGVPGQTVAPVAPIPAASPLAGVPAQPPNTVTPAQAPSPVASVSAQSPMPVPSPVTGTSVPSRAPGAPAVVISQAGNVVINPSPGASVAVGAPSQPPVVSGQVRLCTCRELWLFKYEMNQVQTSGLTREFDNICSVFSFLSETKFTFVRIRYDDRRGLTRQQLLRTVGPRRFLIISLRSSSALVSHKLNWTFNILWPRMTLRFMQEPLANELWRVKQRSTKV